MFFPANLLPSSVLVAAADEYDVGCMGALDVVGAGESSCAVEDDAVAMLSL